MESFKYLFEGSIPYCAGKLDLDLILFYQGLDEKPYSLHFPTTADEINNLIKNSKASPFGKGGGISL